MKKKILALLPESIGGRLTITSLFKGLEQCGMELTWIDKLDAKTIDSIKELEMDEYSFIVSYDFAAIELKKQLGLNIKTVNYFSDVIESNFSGANWNDCYKELEDKDNYVFYWDKELTEQVDETIANIHYLPHAVDTDTYKNLNIEPEYDVMFAGRLIHEKRTERFLNILKALPSVKFAFYCFPKHLEEACNALTKEDAELLKSIYKGFIDSEEKMCQEINKSKVVINFTAQGKSSLNYRTFQVLACERLLLTDYRTELDELFTVGKDIITYKDDSDLIEKIKYYLSDAEQYKDLTLKGRKAIEKFYSAKIAAQKIIDTIEM